EWQSAADGDATIRPVAGQYPVYIGEFGVNPDGVDDGFTGVAQPSSGAWTQNMIAWANQRGYSWTAWSFTPDASPCLLADTFDTLLGAYTGTSVAGLALVASNDDANGGQTSSVTFSAVAGVTYQVAVDGYGGATGGVTLNVALTPSGPANNNFASRAPITGS